MIAIEIALLILAYTLMTITIFLEMVCYKRNLESPETIAFSVSILLLIVALTISPLLGHSDTLNTTHVFTLISMVLVAWTTPVNIMSERVHKVNIFWKKLITGLAIGLLVMIIGGYLTNRLYYLQYITAIYLGVSVLFSMILIRTTKPDKKNLHREKVERLFALAFIVIVPLSLAMNYIVELEDYELKVGFTIPMIFILLAGSKLQDDLQRLSLFRIENTVPEKNLLNYGLTQREQEIALLLTQGITYKQIAENLHISMPTVKTHSSNVYRKCGVKNRSELTALLIH